MSCEAQAITTGVPIEQILPLLSATLAEVSTAVVAASPGSGKSTVLPLRLLEEAWLAGKQIYLLQPRRVAAKSIALRLAELSQTPIGALIGYQIRHEQKRSAQTRIMVVTEGILTRILQSDPALEGVGAVLFDEFHERSLHAELACALTLEVQETLRPDLRILMMSATIDERSMAAFLPGVPILNAPAKAFPLSIEYLSAELSAAPTDRAFPEQVARSAWSLYRREPGDLLAFLPGVAEIQRAIGCFTELAAAAHEPVAILPLYGELPYTQQALALRPDAVGRRRVVFATPVAETSLTLDGVRLVVDGGLARVPRFDVATGLTRLMTERISLDSAEQRAGRAARQQSGVCLRLWTKQTELLMRTARTPEMVEADLAPLALELAAWGSQPSALRWYTPPPVTNFETALALLRQLGAVDDRGLVTPAGREALTFGIHPRLGMLLLRAQSIGAGALACDVAAILEERDPLSRLAAPRVDLSLRVEALRAFRARGRKAAGAFGADVSTLERIQRVASDLARKLKVELACEEVGPGALGLLVAFAYPERIVQRKLGAAGRTRYVMRSGGGATLLEEGAFRDQAFLAASRILGGTGDCRIALASELPEAELRTHFADQIETEQVEVWDARLEAVAAYRIERLGELELRSTPVTLSPDRAFTLFLRGIQAGRGIQALPWDDAARSLQARVELCRTWCPELEFPEISDQRLEQEFVEWVGPFCNGMQKLADLARLNVSEMLKQRLSYKHVRELDELFPLALTLPKGGSRRIDYLAGAIPVLAATVQELFGWKETPRLARGRLPVLLHILSPARRPVQVTQDLGGFWNSSYREVRRELKGRYPKHSWPEAP